MSRQREQSTIKRPDPPREFTVDEVAQHASLEDYWLICDGYVYDVSKFLNQHPGGAEIILKYGGKDVTIPMRDEHLHTPTAFRLMESYVLGVVKGVDMKNKQAPHKHDPVDYTKATLYQVGYLGKDYDQWVHTAVSPENGTVRLFDTDLMEFFTHTPWYVVPICWVPLVLYFMHLSMSGAYGPELTIQNVLLLFGLGLLIYTAIEYLLHRFVFHTVPSSGYWKITIHYLLHGLHHKSPMEKGRLVLPPALFCVVAAPIVLFNFLIFPAHFACGLIAGEIAGYILYDMSHYYVHHNMPKWRFAKDLKTYHMRHHYENYELGFGVSQHIWDVVCHTELPSLR